MVHNFIKRTEMRPIDDIDYELDATHIAIRGLVTRIEQLEKERETALRRISKELYGTIKKGYCLCRWNNGEMEINNRCPQHGMVQKLDQPSARL